ncbi:MAG: DegT/DnrJ/EryC1/StrS family aminotransferase [Desulfobacula sp.]|jgi:dTDP-4-amino-4,6-dideoxygalactose transaminase
MIHLTAPSIEEDDLQAVRNVLESGFLVQGVKVAEFERVLTEYTGAKYAIAVSNCTAALHLSLLSLNIGTGDLVAVPSYSWIATANVVELCGAFPVFVDIDPQTFNINTAHLESVIQKHAAHPHNQGRLRAILPVHSFGSTADMPAIIELAEHYQLPVIEDAACALGASIDCKKAGAWGKIGCFSFHPRKAVTTGEGGMIVTDDEQITHRLRILRNHGQDPPEFVMPGFNYRLTEFQAALGIVQMNKIERIIAARRHSATVYDRLFMDTPIQIQTVLPGSRHIYQSYVILLPNNINRSALIHFLKERGIETTIGTIHMPMTEYYRTHYSFKLGDFPITDRIASHSLTLPLYEKLSEKEQQYVVDAVLEGLKQ